MPGPDVCRIVLEGTSAAEAGKTMRAASSGSARGQKFVWLKSSPVPPQAAWALTDICVDLVMDNAWGLTHLPWMYELEQPIRDGILEQSRCFGFLWIQIKKEFEKVF